MDTIHITGLEIKTVIGTFPEERMKKQSVWLDLHLSGDFRKAGETDDLNYAANYRTIEEEVLRLGEESHFLLLESLGEKIAETCLKFAPIEKVGIILRKPGASLRQEKISVEINREK